MQHTIGLNKSIIFEYVVANFSSRLYSDLPAVLPACQSLWQVWLKVATNIFKLVFQMPHRSNPNTAVQYICCTRRHFFCLDTKEMTKEKVKTHEKYG
jgi:hypothetical protein